jgi:Xaa-Pro aminopeptidase
MIKQKEYAKRRDQLMRMAGEGSIIIVCAAPERIRSNDVHYPYRQDSDFLYLTGFLEPEALLVMIPGKEGGKCILFCRERDPEREMWDGPMAGLHGAVSELGMDEAFSREEIGRRLPPMLHDRERIYYDLGSNPVFDQRLIGWLNEFQEKPRRTFHAPEEIMPWITCCMTSGYTRVARTDGNEASPGRRRGARTSDAGMPARHERGGNPCRTLTPLPATNCVPSYQAIVGGGANACILHYIANKAELRDGDLLLIDAGAEYDGYASDITRTFPVNGKYSPEQKDLYEVVLAAQLAAIDKARPGVPWQRVHDEAVHVATQGMIDLGILKLSLDEELEQEGYKHFYVHNTGHWLGLDVHDVGEYQIDGESRELEPGMVMTVEPGIYIPPNDTSVRKCFRGVGIRIEDDIAITRTNPGSQWRIGKNSG